MTALDLYRRDFEADCVHSGVRRRAVRIALCAESLEGRIEYRLSLAFFPHEDEEDFLVTYDACAEKVLYSAPGRRSRKREKVFLSSLRDEADALADAFGAVVFWDRPLGPDRGTP